MLIKELRYLELNHLVTRSGMETDKLAVIYALTEHGHSLEPVIQMLVAWGLKHQKEVLGK